MIRSMTGFAAVSREESGDKVGVTLKSVNHRFLDVQIKAPPMLTSIEHRLRVLLQQRLTRGRVEVTLVVERIGTPAREVVLDERLLERVVEVLEGARARGLVAGELTMSDILRLPQVLEVRPKGDTGALVPEGLSALVETVVREGVEALVVMRETEGRFLATDLAAKLAAIDVLVSDLERLASEGQSQLTARLREKVAELPLEVMGDPAALAQEIIRFVARSDIDEEIVRLRGHMAHWHNLATGPEACGRQLEFLIQEMNREINTIGSKAEGGRATEAVIAAKGELERLREQVQNVE